MITVFSSCLPSATRTASTTLKRRSIRHHILNMDKMTKSRTIGPSTTNYSTMINSSSFVMISGDDGINYGDNNNDGTTAGSYQKVGQGFKGLVGSYNNCDGLVMDRTRREQYHRSSQNASNRIRKLQRCNGRRFQNLIVAISTVTTTAAAMMVSSSLLSSIHLPSTYFCHGYCNNHPTRSTRPHPTRRHYLSNVLPPFALPPSSRFSERRHFQVSLYQQRSSTTSTELSSSPSVSATSSTPTALGLAASIRQCYEENETDGIVELFSSVKLPLSRLSSDEEPPLPPSSSSSSPPVCLLLDPRFDIVQELIPAVLDAVMKDYRKGAVASVMNGIIGGAVTLLTKHVATTDSTNSDRIGKQHSALTLQERMTVLDHVDQLVVAFEDVLDKEYGVTPDILTYSLAYSAASSFLTGDGNADDVDIRTRNKAKDMAFGYLEQVQRQSKKVAGSKRRKILASSRRRSESTFVEAEQELKSLLGDDFRVFEETDSYAVICKPSGIPCYHRKTTTAGKIKRQKNSNKKKKDSVPGHDGANSSKEQQEPDISLEDALIHCNVALSTLNPDALGIVHRLDRGASGCMVIAKNDEMHAMLVTEFFLRRTTKKYTAFVTTRKANDDNNNNIQLIPIDDEGDIDSPVDNRPAKSKYRVVERYDEAGVAMVEFEILTGRKHQIRVHAADILKCPILNDPLYGYGPKTGNDESASDKQKILLHSSELSIPLLGIHVSATELPSWWDEILQSLST